MSGLRHPVRALSLAIVLSVWVSASALAAGKPAPRPAPAQAASEQFVDGIAAIVDKEVITLAQVDATARSPSGSPMQEAKTCRTAGAICSLILAIAPEEEWPLASDTT